MMYALTKVIITTTSDVSENQCKERWHKVYEVIVEIRGNKLNANGYLIDHSLLDPVVHKVFEDINSCENLAKDIWLEISELCGDNGLYKGHLSIIITVKPIGSNAFVSYTTS